MFNFPPCRREQNDFGYGYNGTLAAFPKFNSKYALQLILVNMAMLIAGCSPVPISNAVLDTDSDITNATWLRSTGPEVRLEATDKNGGIDLIALKPVFIVTGPAGEQYSALNSYSGSGNHAEVVFPHDFNSVYWPKAGRYSWKCFVRSNCIVWGTFEYHQSPPSLSVIYEE